MITQKIVEFSFDLERSEKGELEKERLREEREREQNEGQDEYQEERITHTNFVDRSIGTI